VAVLIDTSSVPPTDRFAFWADATARIFFPLRFRSFAGREFSGRMKGYDLGPLGLFRVTGDANQLVRTHRGIAQEDPEQLRLHLLRRGRLRVSQDDRCSTLTAGDMTTCDSSRPYAIRADRPFDLVIFAFPKSVLRSHGDRLSRRTALRIPGAVGMGSLVAPFLGGIADRLDDGSVPEGHVDLGESIMDLLKAVSGESTEWGPSVSRPVAAGRLAQVKSYVNANLADPELSPQTIAAAQFISVRYLHKLFEAEGTTVSAWIQRQRLDGCRRDLGDPALAGQSIGAIGRAWGLPTPARFSRLFHKAYGCSPRKFREAAARGALPPPSGR
jgi:AraC-like DNA-binding protein